MVIAATAPVVGTSRGLPRLSRFLVERPRLTGMLHAALGDGLCLLQAPAGFGKTTLLVQFASEVDYSTRWVSIDPSCNAPEVLSHRLATAILDDPAYSEPPVAKSLGDLKVYLRDAVQRAANKSERPLLIIVDDLHALADMRDTECGELVDWLTGALPFGAELVLSSREAIQLPEVDRRLASGDVTILGKDALAFTTAEIESLVEARDCTLSAEDVLAATDGWPMGAAAVTSGRAPVPGGAPTSGVAAWDRYVAREFWEFLPPEIERLLLRLSIGESVDPDLAERLMGREAWDILANWLEDHDFLLDILPRQRVRLNPMLRHFLQRQFRRHDRTAFEAAVTVAADWHERRGQIPEAFELGRHLESGETVASLAERHGRQLLYQGALVVLTRAMDSLSPSLFEQRPMLGAIRARLLAQVGAPEESLAQAAAVLDSPHSTTNARVLALLARQRVYRLLGRIDELDGVFKAVRALPGWNEEPSVAAEVAFSDADVRLTGYGDIVEAEVLLRECIARAREAGWVTLELVAQSSLGQLRTMRGDGPAAVADLTKAAQGWRAISGTSHLGWVLNNLGMACLMVGDFENAVRNLEQAAEQARACDSLRTEAYATASLAEAEMGIGQFDNARMHYDRALQLCSTAVRDESLMTLSLAGLSNALLALGDLQQADYMLARARVIADDSRNPIETGTVQMVDALVRGAAHRPDFALQLAQECVATFDRSRARPNMITGRFVLAYCQFQFGKRPDALRTLNVMHGMIDEPWQAGVLIPFVRQLPLFAQWAAAGEGASVSFKETVARHVHPVAPVAKITSTLPHVAASSLGLTSVAMNGEEIREESWASSRAKELFFVLLAHRDGIRKEEAVELLYPDLSAEKCNSAFHSNLYRVRKALFPECVVKRGGTYLLNPDATFDWDVQEFESALGAAEQMEAGTPERAASFEAALQMYRGPFASAFYSEWAETLRRRLEGRSAQAAVTLAGYHAGTGAYERAADCLEPLLERERYDAVIAYDVALYRARAGHPMRALAVIDECKRAHEQDLGVGVPGRLRELRSQIASGIAV